MFRKRSQTSGASTPELQDISLRALEVFAAVEETGSLTLAAARLGGSRSAVSQHITNLERIIGAPLLDRSARPILLTPVGHILSRHAARILHALSEARIELMEPHLESLMEIRVGAIDDLDAYLAADLVTGLRELYPRSQVTLTSGRSDALCTALAERRVDLVIAGYLPEQMAGYHEIPILREPFVLVARKGLLDPDRELPAQMQDKPFVRYNASMPIGRAIAQHLRRLRIELSAPYSFDASRAVFAMMARIGGWTITTPLSLLDAGEDAKRLECFRLPFAGLDRTIRIIARGNELGRLPERLAELSRALIESRVLPAVAELAPWLAGEVDVLGNSGSALRRDASAREAAGS